MSLKVRCLLCSKILSCTREDTSSLLEHIREYHPEVTVLESSEALTHMAPSEEKKPPSEPEKKKTVQIESDPMISYPGGDTERLSKQEYNVRSCTNKSGRKRLYKTSIEKWRPGVGLIFCPKCGKKRRPIVKSHTEKISTSTFGAACILTCWPFCFFPCLFPSPAKEYLHCPVCDNFLGLYEKEKNCIRPNRQFVENEQEFTDKEEEKPPPEEKLPVDKKTDKKKLKEEKKQQEADKKKREEEEKKKKKLEKNQKQQPVEEEEFFDANPKK